MKPSNDFGYRSLGPGFLAQLYVGSFEYSYVDHYGGDLIEYSRKKTHRLKDTPFMELVRATFFDSITIIEYAIKDLATAGKLRKHRLHSSSQKYTPKLLHGELSWVFDPSDPDQTYSFEWCCDALDLNPTYVRNYLEKRIKRALEIAKEIQLGIRQAKPFPTYRQGGLFCETTNPNRYKPVREFFGDLEDL